MAGIGRGIAAFGAGRRVLKAGFKVLEIDRANGYLPRRGCCGTVFGAEGTAGIG